MPDHSLKFVREGDAFAGNRCRVAAGDVGETRVLGRRAGVIGGRDGAALFYDETKLQRRGAVPYFIRSTLFGAGAVHALDDAAHRQRKAMFLSLLTPDAAVAIADNAQRQWHDLLAGARGPIVLFDTAVQVHAAAVSAWAGIPAERSYPRLADDLATIVDGFGAVGPRYARAWLARRRANRWAAGIIEAARADTGTAAPGTALAVVAGHRDQSGRLLPTRVAGVELLNILRPTVAAAWFVAFTALALHDNPSWRARLAAGSEPDLEAFAHETRRLYPFVPLLAARARCPFTWKGHRFRRHDLVLLDVYGTLHDPALWADPDGFDPDRFLSTEPDPFTLIPQGGGPPDGHRCPGERVVIELIKTAARTLASRSYEMPEQDLGYSLSRMPTRPRSGAVIRLTPETDSAA